MKLLEAFGTLLCFKAKKEGSGPVLDGRWSYEEFFFFFDN